MIEDISNDLLHNYKCPRTILCPTLPTSLYSQTPQWVLEDNKRTYWPTRQGVTASIETCAENRQAEKGGSSHQFYLTIASTHQGYTSTHQAYPSWLPITATHHSYPAWLPLMTTSHVCPRRPPIIADHHGYPLSLPIKGPHRA